MIPECNQVVQVHIRKWLFEEESKKFPLSVSGICTIVRNNYISLQLATVPEDGYRKQKNCSVSVMLRGLTLLCDFLFNLLHYCWVWQKRTSPFQSTRSTNFFRRISFWKPCTKKRDARIKNCLRIFGFFHWRCD